MIRLVRKNCMCYKTIKLNSKKSILQKEKVLKDWLLEISLYNFFRRCSTLDRRLMLWIFYTVRYGLPLVIILLSVLMVETSGIHGYGSPEWWVVAGWFHLRSQETRINLLFQFAPEKLGRFETQCWNFGVFLKHAFFSNSAQNQVRPISR